MVIFEVSKTFIKRQILCNVNNTLQPNTTAWVRIPAWACKKVARYLGLGGVFTGYSGFLHYIQLASHELATIGINVTKNKIPNSKIDINLYLHTDCHVFCLQSPIYKGSVERYTDFFTPPYSAICMNRYKFFYAGTF